MSRVNSDDIITNVKSCDLRIKNGSATVNVTKVGETSTEDNFTGNEIYQQTYDKLQNRYDDVGYQYQSDKDKISDILPTGCAVLYNTNPENVTLGGETSSGSLDETTGSSNSIFTHIFSHGDSLVLTIVFNNPVFVNTTTVTVTGNVPAPGSANPNQITNIDTSNLSVGMIITGTNIPAGTTISAMSGSGSGQTITLSNDIVSGSGDTGVSLTFVNTPLVNITIGGVNQIMTLTSGSGTDTLTFTYTIQTTDSGALVLTDPVQIVNSDSITDDSNNAVNPVFTAPPTGGITINGSNIPTNTAPLNLTATRINQKIRLEWNHPSARVTDPTTNDGGTYQIHKATTGSFSQIGSVANNILLFDYPAACGKDYKFKVRGTDIKIANSGVIPTGLFSNVATIRSQECTTAPPTTTTTTTTTTTHPDPPPTTTTTPAPECEAYGDASMFIKFGTYVIPDRMIVSYVNDAGQEFELADTGEVSTGFTGVSPAMYSEYPHGYWSGVFDGYVSGVKEYDACDLKVCVQASGAGTAWWFQWCEESATGVVVHAQNGGQNSTPICFGHECALPITVDIDDSDCEDGGAIDYNTGYCAGSVDPQDYYFDRRIKTTRGDGDPGVGNSYNVSKDDVNVYFNYVAGALDHFDASGLLYGVVLDVETADRNSDFADSYHYERQQGAAYLVVCSGDILYDATKHFTTSSKTFTFDYEEHEADQGDYPPLYECPDPSMGGSGTFEWQRWGHAANPMGIRSYAGDCGLTNDGNGINAPAFKWGYTGLVLPILPSGF